MRILFPRGHLKTLTSPAGCLLAMPDVACLLYPHSQKGHRERSQVRRSVRKFMLPWLASR